MQWLILPMLMLGLWLLGSGPAIASIHHYPEGDRQMMVRSLQTLRDETDRAWQVVLYKRVRDGLVTTMHLRLVGFPGDVSVAHPRSLQILTPLGTLHTAPDVLAESALAPDLSPSVGEYDLMAWITQLQSDAPLRLSIAQIHQPDAVLPIPPFAVKEWRRLVSED